MCGVLDGSLAGAFGLRPGSITPAARTAASASGVRDHQHHGDRDCEHYRGGHPRAPTWLEQGVHQITSFAGTTPQSRRVFKAAAQSLLKAGSQADAGAPTSSMPSYGADVP